MAKERKNTGKEIAETQRLINELKKLASAGSDTKAIFESVRTILNSPSPLLAKQVEDLSKIATKSTQVQNSLKNLAQVQGTLGETARDVILEYNDLVDATDRIVTSQKDLDSYLKKSSKGFKQQAKDTKSQSQASQDLNKKIGEQSTAMRAAMEAAVQYSKASKAASNSAPLKIEVPTAEDFTKPGGPLDPNFYYQTPGQNTNTQAQPTNTSTQAQPANTSTQTQPARSTEEENTDRSWARSLFDLVWGNPVTNAWDLAKATAQATAGNAEWSDVWEQLKAGYTDAARDLADVAAPVIKGAAEVTNNAIVTLVSELTGLSEENTQFAINATLMYQAYKQIKDLIGDLYNGVKNLTTTIMNIGEEAARKLSQPIEDALGFLTLRQANIIAERTRDTAFNGTLNRSRYASYDEYLNVLAAFAQETGRIGTVADVNRQKWTDATEASVALVAELGDYSQMGSGEVLKLSRLFTRLGGLDPLGTLGEQFSLFVVKAAEAEGIVPEIITKDVLENADLLSTYFANNAMSATKTALAVRKLGFALGDIASLEDFFYNYEASTQAALEFQVATGMKFDPTEARTALVSGDIESFVRNLAEQISYDEFQSMSGPQRKLAATAFGLEGRVDKLQEILQIYETTGGEGLDEAKLKEIENKTVATDIGLLKAADDQNKNLRELIEVVRGSYLPKDGVEQSTKQADSTFYETMVYKKYDRLLEDLEYKRLDVIREAFHNTLNAIEERVRKTHEVFMDYFPNVAAAAGQFVVELTDSIYTTVKNLPEIAKAIEKLRSDDENVRKEGMDYLLEQGTGALNSANESLGRLKKAAETEQITAPPLSDLGLPNYSVPPIERQIEDGIFIPYEDEALEYYKEMVVSLDRLGEKMDKNVNALRDKNLNTSVYLDSRNMYNTFSDYGTNYRMS